jgi:hypothetical protein
MKAAICSRGTGSEGLYVVADVPFVSPAKYASAIAQKKMFDEGTSVNGMAIICPPHVPVESARSRVDSNVKPAISVRSIVNLIA